VSPDQGVTNPFFDHPILNSPYVRPTRRWELDTDGQPTQKILETRRRAEFITPIPKPRKQKYSAAQEALVFMKERGFRPKSNSTILRPSLTGTLEWTDGILADHRVRGLLASRSRDHGGLFSCYQYDGCSGRVCPHRHCPSSRS
jgi:hypothetical protein